MALSQAASFLYNTQLLGLSAERENLKGPLVLRGLQTWSFKDKLNTTNELSVTVFKSDINRNKIFFERDIFVPAFNFTGIITGLEDVNDTILKIIMKEEAWHFTRRLYKIEDSLKEYNLVLVKPASLPDMLEDLIGSANADMPILDTTEISGLISLWRLNSTPNDDKGSNNGTWTGTPAYADGIFHNDKAADFKGVEYITTADTPFDFEKTDKFSVSFLLKHSLSGVSDAVLTKVFDQSPAFQAGWAVWIFTGNGQVRLDLQDGSAEMVIRDIKNRNDGLFHHYVFTYDGSNTRVGMKLYVDGVSITVNTEGATSLAGSILNSESVTIGAWSNGTDNLTGQMDDVRIYNKELTSKEAEKLFLQTQSGIDTIIQRVNWKLGEGDSLEIPNLVSLWQLNDNALDAKGSNDGTITGTTTTFVTGKYGKALDFNGSDTKVDCGSDTSLANIFDGGGTISAIINPRSDGELSVGRIFDKDKILLSVGGESNGFVKIQFIQVFASSFNRWDTAVDIPINKTTVVFVHYDNGSDTNEPTLIINGEIRTVANGKLTKTNTGTGSRSSDTGDTLFIGTDSPAARTFDGFIDDVRFYSRILTQVEFKRLLDAKDSFIDKIRSDEVPATTDIDFDVKWKSYYEVLKQIATNSLNDLFFEDNKVLFGTKGKTIILDRDDKIYEKLKTKLDLDTFGNIVNVVGAEVGGTNVHSVIQASETDLLYNYERVVSNNNLKDQAAVDGVAPRILEDFDSIKPDVKIAIRDEIIHKYDMRSGDIIKIVSNSETQTVKGFYRLIEVTSSSTRSLIKLQFSKTGKFIPRISDSLDILEAALIKIHDVELNS